MLISTNCGIFRSCCCSHLTAFSFLSGHCSMCQRRHIQGSDPTLTPSVVIIWLWYSMGIQALRASSQNCSNFQAVSGVSQGLEQGGLRSWLWIMCDSNALWPQQCLLCGRRQFFTWERDAVYGLSTAVPCQQDWPLPPRLLAAHTDLPVTSMAPFPLIPQNKLTSAFQANVQQLARTLLFLPDSQRILTLSLLRTRWEVY